MPIQGTICHQRLERAYVEQKRSGALSLTWSYTWSSIGSVIRINVHEAKAHLSSYLDRLERGEADSVIICRRNQPIAELRALPTRRSAPRPLTKDPRFHLAQSFFEPLPDDLISAFEGREP